MRLRHLVPPLALVLCGCFGGMVIHSEERPLTGTQGKRGAFQGLTSQQVLQSRGQPTRVAKGESDEVWTYTDAEAEWVGVVVAIVLPIPLLLPVAHEETEIRFRDGVAESAVERSIHEDVFLCGIIFKHSWGVVCGVD